MVPAGTVNDTSSTAVSALPSTVKVFVTALTSIFGASPASVLRRRKPGSRSCGVAVGVEGRDVGVQLPCVGRRRRGEDRRGPAGLLDDAVLEHHQRVRPLGGDRQVVGDEQQADIELVLQSREQVEDPLLDRDVERGGRLVRDQQRRPGEDRQADQHPLQHAAGQLVRVGVVDTLGVVEPDLGERLQDELLADRLVGLVEERGRLLRLGADRPHRVECVAGVLRDEPDGPSPQRPEADARRVPAPPGRRTRPGRWRARRWGAAAAPRGRSSTCPSRTPR